MNQLLNIPEEQSPLLESPAKDTRINTLYEVSIIIAEN